MFEARCMLLFVAAAERLVVSALGDGPLTARSGQFHRLSSAFLKLEYVYRNRGDSF